MKKISLFLPTFILFGALNANAQNLKAFCDLTYQKGDLFTSPVSAVASLNGDIVTLQIEDYYFTAVLAEETTCAPGWPTGPCAKHIVLQTTLSRGEITTTNTLDASERQFDFYNVNLSSNSDAAYATCAIQKD